MLFKGSLCMTRSWISGWANDLSTVSGLALAGSGAQLFSTTSTFYHPDIILFISHYSELYLLITFFTNMKFYYDLPFWRATRVLFTKIMFYFPPFLNTCITGILKPSDIKLSNFRVLRSAEVDPHRYALNGSNFTFSWSLVSPLTSQLLELPLGCLSRPEKLIISAHYNSRMHALNNAIEGFIAVIICYIS
jgi:hypothetical protein